MVCITIQKRLIHVRCIVVTTFYAHRPRFVFTPRKHPSQMDINTTNNVSEGADSDPRAEFTFNGSIARRKLRALSKRRLNRL
ncbi:hypothetical protein M378DRAFT_169352 [Amanita muscaria Koide BX008]|uniref:Uncharacterized protein n=1 Tax=Amanita muscaria (strain Koide BX008) TaxID=946122 RepID=A0A0C2WST8_AMAMK|nr:hypothetical protein M378DRAFT_169352 [Amanita muscaria Koide BX008]